MGDLNEDEPWEFNDECTNCFAMISWEGDLPETEREAVCHYCDVELSRLEGAAVAFGLMGMAEAIHRRTCDYCDNAAYATDDGRGACIGAPDPSYFETAMCQKGEHGECLSFICGCACHD